MAGSSLVLPFLFTDYGLNCIGKTSSPFFKAFFIIPRKISTAVVTSFLVSVVFATSIINNILLLLYYE
jgi:hypothetical protein